MRRVKEAELNMKIKGIISEYEKEMERHQARDGKEGEANLFRKGNGRNHEKDKAWNSTQKRKRNQK